VTADPSLAAGFRLATADDAVEVTDTATARVAARRAALSRHALTLLGVA
jgi:hypothetical protein